MRTLFLVEGNTGEYSDSVNWMVCGYWSKATAERRMAELNALAQQLMPQRSADDGLLHPEFWSQLEEASETLRLHDPAGHMDYTGTWYRITEVNVDVEE